MQQIKLGAGIACPGKALNDLVRAVVRFAVAAQGRRARALVDLGEVGADFPVGFLEEAFAGLPSRLEEVGHIGDEIT